jgi:hydrogenase maturation protein HypF
VPVLAVGGQLKATFALADDGRAILSHHLGDLDHFEAYRAFERDVALYEQLFSIRPKCLAHDLHPDYASTRYATSRAAEEGIRVVAIQHHHAHMASCMAEHGLSGPVIGVSFDGTGYGIDGAIWGGEFLVGDYRAFRRAAHLRYVGLPGGERAVREPWRMAVAHLLDAGIEPASVMPRLDADAVRIIEQMLQRKFNSPPTSSAGRLFDAVASLANVRDRVSFEGQAAMRLEWLASESLDAQSYPREFSPDPSGSLVIDTRPMICAIANDLTRGTEVSTVARRFHNTMASMIADTCVRIREETRIDTAVLSGGVFMNALLATDADAALCRAGFNAYRHRQVPPNDGGLSLGQVAIAAALWPEPNI